MNVNVASCQHTGGAESSVPELRKYKGQERLHRRKELNLPLEEGEFHSKNIRNGHIRFSGPRARNMEVATPSSQQRKSSTD